MEPAEEKEDYMARKKGKSVSFDAMIKFFMQYYNIPTKKDIEKLIERMDRLEKVIKESDLYGKGDSISTLTSSKETRSASRSAETSYNMVLEVIKRFKDGIGFSEIQERTGFGEKKLRNIIYRLHKMKKIARKSRGIYIAS
jgi:DNA-binding Lrp family transcriptional regulator